MALHCRICFTAAHRCKFALFQASHSCSLGWVCIILCVILLLTYVALIIQGIPLFLIGVFLVDLLPFTWVVLHHPMCPTTVQRSGFSSSHVPHCYLLFCSALSQVSHCLSIVWLLIVSGVPLHLTRMAKCCFRYIVIFIHSNSFVLSRVFHCCSQAWLSAV